MRNHNLSHLRSGAAFAAVFVVLSTGGAGCKAKSPPAEPPVAAPAAPAAPPTPAGPMHVTVSKDGYTPASITAPAGKDTTLIFRRVDEQNCGDTLVFPKLNIRKDLPLNEDVTVTIPAQQPQELSFTCGMGMYKGSLVITAS